MPITKIWSEKGPFPYVVCYTAKDKNPAALWNKTIELARELVKKLEADGIQDATIFEEMNHEKPPQRKVIQMDGFKVLCDDGSQWVWKHIDGDEWGYIRLADVPQP